MVQNIKMNKIISSVLMTGYEGAGLDNSAQY